MDDYVIEHTYCYYYDGTGSLVEKRVRNREEYLKKVGGQKMHNFYENEVFNEFDDGYNNDWREPNVNDSPIKISNEAKLNSRGSSYNNLDNNKMEELEDEYWSD